MKEQEIHLLVWVLGLGWCSSSLSFPLSLDNNTPFRLGKKGVLVFFSKFLLRHSEGGLFVSFPIDPEHAVICYIDLTFRQKWGGKIGLLVLIDHLTKKVWVESIRVRKVKRSCNCYRVSSMTFNWVEGQRNGILSHIPEKEVNIFWCLGDETLDLPFQVGKWVQCRLCRWMWWWTSNSALSLITNFLKISDRNEWLTPIGHLSVTLDEEEEVMEKTTRLRIHQNHRSSSQPVVK